MLIVDDDTAARETYKLVFGAKGFEFKEAANGKIALEILKKDSVDIVFLDLAMPVMGGEELMEKMLGDEKLKQIPILVETAQGTPGAGLDRKVQAKFGGKLKFVVFTRPGRLEDIMEAVDKMVTSA